MRSNDDEAISEIANKSVLGIATLAFGSLAMV